jgi:hypothetical protein
MDLLAHAAILLRRLREPLPLAFVGKSGRTRVVAMLWRCAGIDGYKIEAKDGALGHVDDLLFEEARWTVGLESPPNLGEGTCAAALLFMPSPHW